jgi:hypothetical protein
VSTILFPDAEAAMFGRLPDTLRSARFRTLVNKNYWRVFPTSQGKNGQEKKKAYVRKENEALLQIESV